MLTQVSFLSKSSAPRIARCNPCSLQPQAVQPRVLSPRVLACLPVLQPTMTVAVTDQHHKCNSSDFLDAPFAGSSTAAADRGRRKGKGKEVWRRKEKEWSGEWNVKDMDEVAKALRGLKPWPLTLYNISFFSDSMYNYFIFGQLYLCLSNTNSVNFSFLILYIHVYVVSTAAD